MPDTMIQTDYAQAPTASCGVMDGYRSASIGKLVAARAKSSAKIKSIIKDKRAKIENKNGGRAYEYAYADLADVLDAVEDAISEQGLAIFQTTQSRANGSYLVTTLAHESDQWVAAEIRLKSADAGPQIFGSEMTYLRRYAVLAALALAPESDDDGKAAQERTDQQARQRPVQRHEPSRSTQPPSRAPEAIQRGPSDSDEPQHMPLPVGKDGPLVNRWTKGVLEALDGRSIDWRYTWLALHADEMAEVHDLRPDHWQRINVAVAGTDMAEAAE